MLTRRSLVTTLLTSCAVRGQNGLPPVRPITRGPKFHWFAYYDKLQFDPTSRYVLANQVDFEHRSPAPGDEIRMGMIDLKDNDRWTELGRTKSWNWQQGAMLQWVPGSRDEVIWNERDDKEKRFVSVIINVKSGKRRTLPAPVYSLSPGGRWAVYPDFRRLNDTRPGYGYCGLPDPYAALEKPKEIGIWRMNLKSGKTELIIPLAEAAAVPNAHEDMSRSKHWFNHLLFNTDGTRFIFLHRWRGPLQKPGGFATRMFTASIDGKDLYVLDPYGRTSHFIWRDPSHVLAWAWHPSRKQDKFYLYTDRTEQVAAIGPDVMTVNGHCTYLPGNKWILNDAYPDKQRNQNVYLYEIATGKRVELGSFHSPNGYTGEWRCDTHPRFSPGGRWVTIDSPHGGNGRQVYLIDIRGVTKA
jgi:hypothetical protein